MAAAGAKSLKGLLAVTLAIAYPPGSSQRRGHAWRGHGADDVGSGAVQRLV